MFSVSITSTQVMYYGVPPPLPVDADCAAYFEVY
jgi:hypothetical protein